MIRVEDKTIIKDIVFKYPDYMSEHAKNAIKIKYDKYLSLKDKIHSLRENLFNLEEELKIMNDEFKDLDNICTIYYGFKEIEEIKEEAGLVVSNSSDARNK